MARNRASRIRDISSDLVRVLRTTPHFGDWAETGVAFPHPIMARRLAIAEEEINDATNEENRQQIRHEVSLSSTITYFRAPPRTDHDQSPKRPRRRRRGGNQDWAPRRPTYQELAGAPPQDIQTPTDKRIAFATAENMVTEASSDLGGGGGESWQSEKVAMLCRRGDDLSATPPKHQRTHQPRRNRS